jgi:hypothetical protein
LREHPKIEESNRREDSKTEKTNWNKEKLRYDWIEGKNLIVFFFLFGLFIVSLQYKTLQNFSLSLAGGVVNDTFMGV